MNQRDIVGIDIGSSNIYAAVGRVNYDNELELIAKVQKSSKGIEKGKIVNTPEASKALEEAIKELDLLVGESIEDCYITIPSGICTAHNVNCSLELTGREGMAKVTEEHIKRLKEKAENKDSLQHMKPVQFLKLSYKLDGKYIFEEPLGYTGKLLELQCILLCVDYKIYMEYAKLLGGLNRNLKGMKAACESAAELLIDDQDKKRGVALVDIGAQKTDVSVYYDGLLQYTEQIPLGGDNITNDLAYCLEVSHEKAESIKRKYDYHQGPSKEETTVLDDDKHNLAQEVIDARINEIITFVERALKKDDALNDISNIIIYGEGIIHFDNLQAKLGKKVGKNINIVRNSHFNLINSKFINAWGLVKLLYYEVKWEYNGQLDNLKGIDENITDGHRKINKSKEDKKVFSRIKSFLEDFF